MNLDEAQRNKVAAWIAEGLKLSDIQNRLMAEMGIKMTYMDVRFLVDDLKLTPKDPEIKPTPPQASALTAATPGPAVDRPATPAPGAAGVNVKVDQVARPG